MRAAGTISAILVLIAVALGLYSLVDAFGYRPVDLFGLLWPVALGVVVLTSVLLAVGRWSADLLNRSVEREKGNMGDR